MVSSAPVEVKRARLAQPPSFPVISERPDESRTIAVGSPTMPPPGLKLTMRVTPADPYPESGLPWGVNRATTSPLRWGRPAPSGLRPR